MNRWEYCVFGPIHEKYDRFGNLITGCCPKLIKLGLNGREFQDIPEDPAAIVGWLGDQGWEMVSCGNTRDDRHYIYFKRPKGITYPTIASHQPGTPLALLQSDE